MKHLKILGLAAVAAMAMMAFAASASATTLEVGGEAQNKAVELNASLSNSSALLQTTSGSFANTCTTSNVEGATTSFTPTVSGPISSLTFTNCTTNPVVVDKAGSLSIAYSSGTNGTVTSSGAEVTVPSPIGALNCKTGGGVDIGTLTGVKAGNATMDINAVLNCGFLVPSATWTGTYSVTSPAGLGVEN